MRVENFLKNIPPIVSDLVSFFSKRSFEFTVVGGIPRDFLLSGKIGEDWDVELSSSTHAFSVSLWKDLAKELRAFGEVSNLSYQVIRLKVGKFEFEFSPPRTEVFSIEDHHKNFEAEYNLSLLPEVCWKRRDFTINAIGFKLKEKDIQVIDPFDGQKMLLQKVLHPCSEHFVRDPVRYLRAYRFSLKLGFEFSTTLQSYLASMPQNFSPFYLFSEMKKSESPLKFYQLLVRSNCQELPVNDPLILEDSFKKSLIDEFNLYNWMMSLEFIGLSAQHFCDYFSLSKPLCKKLISFAVTSRKLSEVDIEFLKQDFEEISGSEELHLAFSWYYGALQLTSKAETRFVGELIKIVLPEWVYLLSFEPLKDVRHIDPPLRAKYIVWNLCQRI